MPDIQSLLSDAARLPIADRIELIEALWDTDPAEELPPLSNEWLAEIQRRSAQYESGSVETIPWEQVKSAALSRLSRKND